MICNKKTQAIFAPRMSWLQATPVVDVFIVSSSRKCLEEQIYTGRIRIFYATVGYIIIRIYCLVVIVIGLLQTKLQTMLICVDGIQYEICLKMKQSFSIFQITLKHVVLVYFCMKILILVTACVRHFRCTQPKHSGSVNYITSHCALGMSVLPC